MASTTASASSSSSSSPSTPLFTSTVTKHPTIFANAHPYAIKTTSSAVLSRSNSSSPHSPSSAKHHYVPPSPTRSRHRYTSSSSSAEGNEIQQQQQQQQQQPPPLPVPFPFPFPTASSQTPTRGASFLDDATPRRLKRAETLPSAAVPPFLFLNNNNNIVGVASDNPKQWSSHDLASYISTSLQAGTELSAEDQERVLEVIKEQSITGRDFLRLSDADLSSQSVTRAQRLYLLEVSRVLRARILPGRVWVNSHRSKDHPKDVYTRSKSLRSPNSPFRDDDLCNRPVSSVDLILPSSVCARVPRSLHPTTTTTVAAVPMTPSNSGSDSSAQRYQDLARLRIRRRGQVKGLVKTWERERVAVSGSEGSVSGSSDADSDGDVPLAESEAPPPPPQSALSSDLAVGLGNSLGEINEEPMTVEEVLGSSDRVEFAGGCAMEKDCGMGDTVIRIVSSTSPKATAAVAAAAVESRDRSNESRPVVDCDFGFGKLGVTGSGRANNAHKRVVTAIFTGGSDRKICGGSTGRKPMDEDEVSLANLDTGEDISDLEVVAAEPAAGDHVIALLEASIASTRAQLEGFRARLEVVEVHVATLAANQEAQFQRWPEPPEGSELHHEQPAKSDRVPVQDNFVSSSSSDDDDYDLRLKDLARSIIARTMGWFFPYSRPGTHPPSRAVDPDAHSSSREALSRSRPRGLPAFRLSYVIFLSFALCAAVLRRVGFGRGVRGR